MRVLQRDRGSAGGRDGVKYRVPSDGQARRARGDAGKQMLPLATPGSEPPGISPEPDPATFSGRRIDLDFRRGDIHRILRILAEVGKVDIVTSEDVLGEVTIKMRDVPWERALRIVVESASSRTNVSVT